MNDLACVIEQAIICGKVRQTPVQKLLRNGRTLTIFSVGTGGMWDHRVLGVKDLPKPAQWHRVVVHHEVLGAYAVQQLVKKYVFECSVPYVFFCSAVCDVSELLNIFPALRFMLRVTLKFESTIKASQVKL